MYSAVNPLMSVNEPTQRFNDGSTELRNLIRIETSTTTTDNSCSPEIERLAKKRRIMSKLLHDQNEIQSPQKVLVDMLRANGQESESRPSLDEDGYFHKPTQADYDSYGVELIQAIRTGNIDALRRYLKDGKSLQCCNRFGESLIHMACRRSMTEVVAFLVEEANVSIRVIDDYGRTPLHDACWTCEPNFELIEILVREAPELILFSDKRGHCPLHYARKHHHEIWNNFITSNEKTFCQPTI